MIDPSVASGIMEDILGECVSYAQHDIAHLLFRAFLRFRKYGCQVPVVAVRHLFESYKENDSKDLMNQLADEMKEDPSLRPLCLAAYLFAGNEEAAGEMYLGLKYSELSETDAAALVEGYGKLEKIDKVVSIIEERVGSSDCTNAMAIDCALRVLSSRSNEGFDKILKLSVQHQVQLDQGTFLIILRHRLKTVTSPESIQAAEEELLAMGYEPHISGASIIISSYARLIQFGDQGSEELMLSKVDTLLTSIESRLKDGDAESDISGAHVRAVIRGYGAAGKPEEMKRAWTRMQCQDITNNIRIYNELLKWFSLMGNVKEVLSLREEMKASSVSLDTVSYTWIFRALGKFYPRHANELFDEMNDRRIKPDIHLYNTMLGVFGDLGQLDRVSTIQSEMKERYQSGTLEYTPITFAILIRIFRKDFVVAEGLFNEAKSMNLHEHPHVLTSMLHACAFAESSEERLDALLATIQSWNTDVYNVLLHKYGKEKNVTKFNEILEKMKKEDVPMNDVTFGTLVTAFARWGEVEKVNDVIQLLKESEGQITATFYSVLASSLNRMGKVSGVDDAWEDLLSSRLFPDTEVFNKFLSLYSRQHNMNKVQKVLNSMMKQVPPNPVTATTVLDMLGKTGHVSEMEDLFHDMKETPDTQPTSVTFHQMMNTYAKSGDVSKMEKIHEEFEKQGYTDNAVTFNILMDGYGRAKRFDQMKEVAAKRVEAGVPLDDRAYCIMITAFGKSRIHEDVLRLFEELQRPENNPLLTQRALWSLIDSFCRCGDSLRMEACIDIMKRTSSSTDLQSFQLMKLVPYYCRMTNMSKVEEILAVLKEGNCEVTYMTANAIARGYARVGRFESAVEWLHYLRDKNWVPDPSTALQLSTVFLKAGLHDQARQILEWRRQYVKHCGGMGAEATRE